MKSLKQIVSMLVAALFFAMIITLVTSPSKRVHAGCGSDVTWNVWNEINSSQSAGTEDWSSYSVQHSDDGQEWTGSETRQVNADGSSTEHEESDYTDKYGNGCNSDGEPWTGHRTRDEEKDPEGNRKEHIEEIIEKDGKCMKWVRDREWDRNGELIKDVESETEVPCIKYNLEVSWEGSYTPPNGAVTAMYGPDTALIPLGLKNGTYTGSYQGQFHATVTGLCNATGGVPVTFDITAKEDEFDLENLEFTVTRSFSFSWNTICPGLSGGSTTPTQTITDTFTLPLEEGASQTFSHASGGPAVTYTLKKNRP